MINLEPTPAKFTSGIVFMGSFVHSLRRCPVAGCFMALLTRLFAVPLAVVFLLWTNVTFSIFLGGLLFHPALDHTAARADTDSSVPDVKAAKKGRRYH